MSHRAVAIGSLLALGLIGTARLCALDPPTQLWTDSWDGLGNHNDEAYLAAFDATGAIYVAGTNYEPGAGADHENFFLRRYTQAGAVDWTVFHGAAGYDAPSELLVTAAGQLALTGFSWDEGQRAVATIVYDTSGAIVWDEFAPISGTVRTEDYPPRMVEDNSGNLVVGVTSNDDYLLLKYSPTGSLLWTRSFDGPSGGPDFCADVATDAMGNAYVTGIVHDAEVFGQAAVTLKFDAAGNFQWEHTETGVIGTFFQFAAIEIAPDGDVVVAANPESTCGVFQARVWKLAASDGTLHWLEFFPPQPCDSVEPTHLALTADGSVVLTGFGNIGSASIRFQTIRYATNGQLQWHREYEGPGSGGAMPARVVVDAAGNSYVAGFTTFLPQNRDHVAVRYSASGDLDWEIHWPGAITRNDEAMGIAVRANGDLLLVGREYDPSHQYDATTLLYQAAQPTSVEALSVGEPSTLRVWPNPSSTGTWLSLPHAFGEGSRVEVYDLRGRRVLVLHPSSGSGLAYWDGQDGFGAALPAGNYRLRWTGASGRASASVTLLR